MKTWCLRKVEKTPQHVIRGCVEGSLEEHLGMSMDEYLEARRKCGVPRLAIHAHAEDVEKEKALEVRGVDEVVLMGGVGHWMHHARVEEFNEVLTGWLESMEEA
ncbi:hypothetical protein PMIN03_004264 [Paraphaeosphaeria minitans]